MMKLFSVIAVLALLGVAIPCHATPVSYTLTGNLQTASISGSITYDPTTGVISAGTLQLYDLTKTQVDSFSLNGGTGILTGFFVSTGITFPLEDTFTLDLDGPFASPTLDTASNQNLYLLGIIPGTPDYLVSGTFTPTAAAAVTPEPSSFVLLGTGVLSLAVAARRRFPWPSLP